MHAPGLSRSSPNRALMRRPGCLQSLLIWWGGTVKSRMRSITSLKLVNRSWSRDNAHEGGGGGGVYLESYTREARFLTRWDQHAVAQQGEEEEDASPGPDPED